MNAKNALGAASETFGSYEKGPRDRAFRVLLDCNTESIPHLSGCLFDHLKRTEQLLMAWGCSESVSTAGLCHALYGTDGFETAPLGLDGRDQLAEAVGEDIESLVYLYASCDRKFLYPQLGVKDRVVFRNRFTGDVFSPSDDRLRDFVDLTLANECDVAVGPGSDQAPDWFSSMVRQFRLVASPSVRHGCQVVMARLSS